MFFFESGVFSKFVWDTWGQILYCGKPKSELEPFLENFTGWSINYRRPPPVWAVKKTPPKSIEYYSVSKNSKKSRAKIKGFENAKMRPGLVFSFFLRILKNWTRLVSALDSEPFLLTVRVYRFSR